MALITSSIPRTLAVWVAIAILSGVAAIAAWRWTVNAAHGVTHSLLIQQQLANWLSAAQDLETGQRGYLLTHDADYLDPYNSAKKSIGKIHADLAELAGDNPQQLATIETIDQTLHERLAVIDKSIAELKDNGDAVSAGADNGLGQKIMDRFRDQIAGAREREQLLFKHRLEEFRSRSFWLLTAMLATLLASAGLAMIALNRERQRVAALELTALTLTTTNRSLEQHVQARTEELAIERDRAEAERERAEALLRDVTHRIGNTLALVVGFINLHIRHTADAVSLKTLAGARDRIHAIASAQRRINVANDLELVRIDTLIQSVMADVVAATAEDRIALTVDMPPLLVPAQAATSLCVLTQEFVVNSLKHAFDGGEDGKISVRLQRTGHNAAELIIEDNGMGLPRNRKKISNGEDADEGLGTKIANLLTRQFGGSISYHPARPGAERPGTKVTLHLTDLALTPATSDGQEQEKSDAHL